MNANLKKMARVAGKSLSMTLIAITLLAASTKGDGPPPAPAPSVAPSDDKSKADATTPKAAPAETPADSASPPPIAPPGGDAAPSPDQGGGAAAPTPGPVAPPSGSQAAKPVAPPGAPAPESKAPPKAATKARPAVTRDELACCIHCGKPQKPSGNSVECFGCSRRSPAKEGAAMFRSGIIPLGSSIPIYCRECKGPIRVKCGSAITPCRWCGATMSSTEGLYDYALFLFGSVGK